MSSEEKKKITQPEPTDNKQPGTRPENKSVPPQQNPPLSVREREHLTYLRILSEYNKAKDKRTNYKHYGFAFIIVSGLVFLALMFSLETKIEFLCLWIVTILYCVVVMIRADYRYHTFKEYLDIADEDDMEQEENEACEEDDPDSEQQKTGEGIQNEKHIQNTEK